VTASRPLSLHPTDRWHCSRTRLVFWNVRIPGIWHSLPLMKYCFICVFSNFSFCIRDSFFVFLVQLPNSFSLHWPVFNCNLFCCITIKTTAVIKQQQDNNLLTITVRFPLLQFSPSTHVYHIYEPPPPPPNNTAHIKTPTTSPYTEPVQSNLHLHTIFVVNNIRTSTFKSSKWSFVLKFCDKNCVIFLISP
jgi:hypothetical protein